MGKNVKSISIDGHVISRDSAPYIVAEMSANHNGSIESAKQHITSAARCGAHAVKLQTYTPDTITINCDNEDFLIPDGMWKGYKLYDLYAEAYTPYDWHKPLFDHARAEGITCFSSPFDTTAVDLLEDLNTPAYKIASFEMIDLPLIKYVAQTKKPMIISTGMATPEEISEALACARDNGCKDIILLHCVSAYPASIDSSNLSAIPKLAYDFNVLTGLSDHSLGVSVATTAVAMGACFIEKHFILDRSQGGPDSQFSIEPKELEELVKTSNLAWRSIGKPFIGKTKEEEGSIRFRRSLYFVKDIKQGEIITSDHVKSIRPGFGILPKYLDKLIGLPALNNFIAGDKVPYEYIEYMKTEYV